MKVYLQYVIHFTHLDYNSMKFQLVFFCTVYRVLCTDCTYCVLIILFSYVLDRARTTPTTTTRVLPPPPCPPTPPPHPSPPGWTRSYIFHHTKFNFYISQSGRNRTNIFHQSKFNFYLLLGLYLSSITRWSLSLPGQLCIFHHQVALISFNTRLAF